MDRTSQSQKPDNQNSCVVSFSLAPAFKLGATGQAEEVFCGSAQAIAQKLELATPSSGSGKKSQNSIQRWNLVECQPTLPPDAAAP
eukprot:248542-Amphidinium_carterae.1